MKIDSLLHRITIYYCYFILGITVFEIPGTDHANLYVFTFAYMVIFLLINSLRLKLSKQRYFIEYIPIIFILTWVYGIISGLLNQNELNYIFRNFAGMTLYVLYYFFITAGISRHDILVILRNLSIILMIFVLYLVLTSGTVINTDGLGFSVFRKHYSLAVHYMIPFLALIMYSWFSPFKDKFYIFKYIPAKYTLLYFFFSMAVFILSGSKAFILSAVIVLAPFLFYLIFRYLSLFKKTISCLCLILGVLLFFILDFPSVPLIDNIGELIKETINLEADENHPRTIQKNVLPNNFSFFGSGLGGAIQMPWMTGPNYGFELTYYAVIHKFGFFSMFIFTPLVLLILIAVRRIVLRKNKTNSIVALSLLAYLGASYGQQILFSPSMVLLTIFSIMFLVDERNLAYKP